MIVIEFYLIKLTTVKSCFVGQAYPIVFISYSVQKYDYFVTMITNTISTIVTREGSDVNE